MTDSWRRSDKKVFEFYVCTNKSYGLFMAIPTLIGIPILLAAVFFFNPPRHGVSFWFFLFIAISIIYSGGWFARKYACGRLRITIDDEGMNFEWIKKIPFKENANARILYADVTAYEFRNFYNSSAFTNSGIIFYNNEKELIRFYPAEPFKWWNAKNDELAFYDFLSMKSQLLKEQNIFQLDWKRTGMSPLQHWWRKRKLRKQAEKTSKLSSN